MSSMMCTPVSISIPFQIIAFSMKSLLAKAYNKLIAFCSYRLLGYYKCLSLKKSTFSCSNNICT